MQKCFVPACRGALRNATSVCLSVCPVLLLKTVHFRAMVTYYRNAMLEVEPTGQHGRTATGSFGNGKGGISFHRHRGDNLLSCAWS